MSMLSAIAGRKRKNDAFNEGGKVVTPQIFAQSMQLTSERMLILTRFHAWGGLRATTDSFSRDV